MVELESMGGILRFNSFPGARELMASPVRYTVRDDFYFDLLGKLSETLPRYVKYAVVGGAATQIHVAGALTGYGREPVEGIPDLVLRPTGDIDVAIGGEDAEALAVTAFNDLAEDSNFSIESRTDRSAVVRPGMHDYKGFKRPVHVDFEVSPEEFRHLPGHYDTVIETAEEVVLRRRNREIGIRAAIPEYIIAAKLVNGRPKDAMDVYRLLEVFKLRGKPVDHERIKSILKSVKRGDLEADYAILLHDAGWNE